MRHYTRIIARSDSDAAISILTLNINNIRSNLDKTEGRWEALLFNKEYRREVVIGFENGKGRIINQGAYNTTLLDEGGA